MIESFDELIIFDKPHQERIPISIKIFLHIIFEN